MSVTSMSGNDTIQINDRVIVDLADGDVGTLTFPNGLAEVKTGKNGNALFAFNNQGRQAEQMLKVIRGSDDDKFLQSLLSTMENNFAGFTLLTGKFIKTVGDGVGNITNDTYVQSGGIFVKRVEAKSNADGDTQQSLSEYHLKWANVVRVIA